MTDRRAAGGRPTREEAARRCARILDVASAMFLAQGFDATSIDSIAAAAAVGKPSLYARYGDKQALFLAVLRRRIDLWVKPFAELSALPDQTLDQGRLEGRLIEFARHLLDASLTPDCIALMRILVAEATRFPELARTLHDEGWTRALPHVAALLERSIDFGRSAVADPRLAADLFMSLVLGRLPHQAMLGIAVDPHGLDGRVRAAVRVFLGTGLALKEDAPASTLEDPGR